MLSFWTNYCISVSIHETRVVAKGKLVEFVSFKQRVRSNVVKQRLELVSTVILMTNILTLEGLHWGTHLG
jgi:hypothetical protein